MVPYCCSVVLASIIFLGRHSERDRHSVATASIWRRRFWYRRPNSAHAGRTGRRCATEKGCQNSEIASFFRERVRVKDLRLPQSPLPPIICRRYPCKANSFSVGDLKDGKSDTSALSFAPPTPRLFHCCLSDGIKCDDGVVRSAASLLSSHLVSKMPLSAEATSGFKIFSMCQMIKFSNTGLCKRNVLCLNFPPFHYPLTQSCQCTANRP